MLLLNLIVKPYILCLDSNSEAADSTETAIDVLIYLKHIARVVREMNSPIREVLQNTLTQIAFVSVLQNSEVPFIIS